jgi:adenylate cyclase
VNYKIEYSINDEIKTTILNKDTITVGKLPGSDIRIEDSSISRNHCKFLKTDNGFRIIDLKSTNGTYVNGKSIDEYDLKIGDNITIGRTLLKFLTLEEKEEYNVVDDQKISMIIPLSEELKVARGDDTISDELNLLTALTSLGKSLISCSTLDDSFEKISDLIFEFIHPKRICIFFADQNQNDLQLKFSITKSGKKEEKVNISKTIALKAIKEKVAILSQNAKDDDRFDGAQSIILYGITSAMSVPIWTKNSIYGLIYVDTTFFDQIFVEKDLKILSIIANFTGLSIEGINSLNKLNIEKKLRARLERYHSPAVVSRIMEQKDEQSIELSAYKETEASVLFMDIVGFTSKAEEMNPVEIGMYLNNLFTAMTEIIFEFNGTLDKYIGDCIMAVFGAPFEIENHAELAILAALNMKKKLAELNQNFPSKEQTRIRIGINSGKLVSGDFGSPKRIDYTVIGNTVNVASRLESSVAKPNDIIVSEATKNYCPDLFEYEFLGDQKLQGLSKPIQAYQVIAKREK